MQPRSSPANVVPIFEHPTFARRQRERLAVRRAAQNTIEQHGSHRFRCTGCGLEFSTVPNLHDAIDGYRIPACPGGCP